MLRLLALLDHLQILHSNPPSGQPRCPSTHGGTSSFLHTFSPPTDEATTLTTLLVSGAIANKQSDWRANVYEADADPVGPLRTLKW